MFRACVPKPPVPNQAPAFQVRPGVSTIRDRVAAAHVDVHHLGAEVAGVDGQRAQVGGRVGDVGRCQSGQRAWSAPCWTR